MSVVVKRLLLDVLKPREVSIVDLSEAVASVEGVIDVEMIVSEVDTQTETLKVTIIGSHLDYTVITVVMEKYGVSLRGIDESFSSKIGSC